MGEENGCGEKKKIRRELRKHVSSSINVHSSSFLKRLKGRESGRKWLTFLLRYKFVVVKWDFHAGEHKSIHLFFLEACFSPSETSNRRVTGWGRIRSVAISLYTPVFLCITSAVAAVWCRAQPWFLSDFSIFNNNLGNQEVKSHPAGQMAWWLPAIPAWLCALGGYIIHTNMLEKSEPLRYIYFYVLWYLHWSNATLNNLIVECCWLVAKITRENNEEPNRFPSVFIWKQQVLESVGFSYLYTVPWRSLLSAFNH